MQNILALKDPAILKKTPEYGRRHQAWAAVVVVSHREQITQKGTRMGITVIEDRSGQSEVMTFSRALETCSDMLKGDQPLLLKLSVDNDRNDDSKVRLSIEECKLLDDAMVGQSDQLRIKLSASQCDAQKLRELKTLLQSAKGTAKVLVQIQVPDHGEVTIAAGDNLRVTVNDALIGKLEQLLGRGTTGMS